MSDLYKRAIDPNQYDLPDLDWGMENITAPTRPLYFNFHLFKHMEKLDNKRCLDIGCGDGQLLEQLIKHGAKNATGIEPSAKNLKLAKTKHPKFRIIKGTLQDYRFKNKFEVITCVMVLVHIENLNMAFKKLKSMLAKNGTIYLIVENFDYYKKPRHGYKFAIEILNRGEAVIGVTRRFGLLADVIRKINIYKDAATQADLKINKHVKLKFTNEFIKNSPRYRPARGKIINHLLVLS